MTCWSQIYWNGVSVGAEHGTCEPMLGLCSLRGEVGERGKLFFGFVGGNFACLTYWFRGEIGGFVDFFGFVLWGAGDFRLRWRGYGY